MTTLARDMSEQIIFRLIKINQLKLEDFKKIKTYNEVCSSLMWPHSMSIVCHLHTLTLSSDLSPTQMVLLVLCGHIASPILSPAYFNPELRFCHPHRWSSYVAIQQVRSCPLHMCTDGVPQFYVPQIYVPQIMIHTYCLL